MKKQLTILLQLSLFCLSTSLYAFGIVPKYTPGGALPSISAQDALNPMLNTKKNGWWYLTGLLKDQQHTNAKFQQHSLQITLVKIPFLLGAIGTGSMAFSFKNVDGQTLYLWNDYANKTMLSHFPVGNFNWKPAGSGQFQIDITPFKISTLNTVKPNFHFNFSKDPVDTKHIAGAFNASYQLSAHGLAQIGGAQHKIQTVYFQFHATVFDKRGLVPEGYAGYVGPTPWDKHVFSDANSSWELAMPQLKLTSWQMTITPTDSSNQSLLKSSVSFSNNNAKQKDMLWLDRQVLYPAKQSLLTSSIQEIARQKENGIKTPVVSITGGVKQLYHGTWMSFCFNKEPYKGYCGNLAVFWQPNTLTAEMDSDNNATHGFMNLYLPVEKTKTQPFQAGGLISENLYFNGNHPITPYRVQNEASNTFASKVSGNHYAQTVFVTLRKHTPVNALLTLKNTDSSKDLLLKFTAISRVTEDVMLTNADAFFEGAGIVSLCVNKNNCTPIGTGFMEQMGYGA